MPKMLRPRYWCIALAVGLTLTAFVPTAQAMLAGNPAAGIPNAGTQATPMGLADTMAGVLPPPGFYWLNYLVYVHKDKLLDSDGERTKITVPPLGIFDQKSKLNVSAFVEAARFVWMTPFKLFGATYGAQVIFTGYNADVKLKAGKVTLAEDHAVGLGDITVNPIILAWHFSPNFHMGAGLDIVLPAGHFDNDNTATQLLASNVVTYEPLVAISYWKPGGIDLSAKIMYDFHGQNTDTDTRPGQEFHFDWGASWGFGGAAPDEFRAGLAGFCYWQTTPEVVRGDKADSDTKSRQFGIGPVVKWWPKMGPISVQAKGLYEFGSRNTAQGYSLWLDSIFAF